MGRDMDMSIQCSQHHPIPFHLQSPPSPPSTLNDSGIKRCFPTSSPDHTITGAPERYSRRQDDASGIPGAKRCSNMTRPR